MAKRKRDEPLRKDNAPTTMPSTGLQTMREHSTEPTDSSEDRDVARVFGRVQAYKGASGDEDFSDSSAASTHAEGGNVRSPVGEGSSATERSEKNASDLEDEPGTDEPEADVIHHASEISFGALAKAQSTLNKERRSNHDRHARLTSPSTKAEALERRAGKKDTREFARPSKHAPSELSSKKAVSRKRSVVPINKPNTRDPRFQPTAGKVNENQVKKNYAFLSSYRDAEIADLKAGIRKTKDEHAREVMEKALQSMESRKRHEQLAEQRQEVLRQHRRQEKEQVKEGKQPFFLKRAEVKERALKERFEGMKSKERQKAVERRRKKITSKERKGMPVARRG